MIQNVASVVTCIAIVFVLFQLVGERKAGHRNFESLYVQRYWTIEDRISAQNVHSHPLEQTQQETKNARVAYLRLCEDQLELREKGYITDATWMVWSWGMKSQLPTSPYLALLDEMDSDELVQLREFIQHWEDPLKKYLPARWWAGLH